MSNTIIRARRRHRFVILDQRAVEDSRLSWAARGLLAYLLSRPDDWRVLINDLRKRGDLGRDGIYKLLRELREAGYVRFQRSRDAQDRIRGGTYLVQEIPGSPHPDLPDTAEPDTAEPDTAEPDTAEPDTASPDPVKPKALLNTDLDLIPITTTIPTTTKGGSCCSEPEADRIEFAAWVPDDLKVAGDQQGRQARYLSRPNHHRRVGRQHGHRPYRTLTARLPAGVGQSVGVRQVQVAVCRRGRGDTQR